MFFNNYYVLEDLNFLYFYSILNINKMQVNNLTSILTNNTSNLTGISSDGTNVWIVGSSMIYQVQCSTTTLVNTINFPTNNYSQYNGISSDGTNVWVSVYDSDINGGCVYQYQCSSGNLVNTIYLPYNPFSVYSDGTSVWLPCDANFVTQLNCSTGAIVRNVNPPAGPTNAVSDGTNAYILVNTGDTVTDIMVINCSSGALSNLNLPGYILGGVTSDTNNVWYTYSSNGQSYLQNYAKNSSATPINISYSSSGTGLNVLSSDGTYVWINSTGGTNYNTYQIDCSTGDLVNTIASGVQCNTEYEIQISADGTNVWIIGQDANASPSFVQIPVGTTSTAAPAAPAASSSSGPYILTLTNSMTIWQGGNPSSTTEYVWNPTGIQSSGGPGLPNLQPNPSYTTVLGKSTTPWIASGFTLNQGEFIGNNNGSLYLIMDMSGNLNLCTTSFSYYSGINLGNNYYGGGPTSNAIYQLPETGNTSLMNNIYYIDANADSHLYSSQYIGQSNNYKKYPNFTTGVDDLAPIYNSSVEECRQICNSNESCAGFVFAPPPSENICYTKTTNMYPYNSLDNFELVNPNLGWTLDTYVKMNQLNSAPVGITTSTKNIDSYAAQKYTPSTDKVIDSFSLTYDISANLTTITNLESQINALADQIVAENITFENSQVEIFKQAIEDKRAIEDFLNDYKIVEKAIKNADSQEYLLNDTALRVVQENYHYLLWSILAIGIVIIGVNVLKKK